ncbi:MAG: hypothetical protein AAB554_04040 [Patescibacteria group bacterium]
MRRYAISTLFLVFALIACAGRQVHARSIPASVPASIHAAKASEAVEASTVESAPVASAKGEPELKTKQPIDPDVRAAAEKMRRIPSPAPLANDDDILAALKIDTSRLREIDRQAAEEFDGLIAQIKSDERALRKKRLAARRPRPNPKAAAGSLIVVPSAVTPPLASAPAAPSILNASPRTPNVLTALAPKVRSNPNSETFSLFVPDRDSVKNIRAYVSACIICAFLVVGIGILSGLLVGSRRNRRLRAIVSAPYDHLPDGTVLILEVIAGNFVTTGVIMPPPRSEPMQDVPSRAPSPHDKFDLTDTPAEPEPPSKPKSGPAALDDRFVFAAGTGKIMTSEFAHEASGVTDASSPPDEPDSPSMSAPNIVYEDDASTLPDATAASTALN